MSEVVNVTAHDDVAMADGRIDSSATSGGHTATPTSGLDF